MTACVACGGGDLRHHLAVGDSRPTDLIPTTDRYGHTLADIVRCADCGHLQLERFPDDDELAAAYAEAASEDYVAEEAGQRATARTTLEQIERHVPRGRLLDLGCWVGFLLAEARDRGWEVTGVEPSGFASSYARDRLGLDVRRGDLFEVDLPAGAYDAVVLGDVIEHLVRPGDALERIADLLAPGGVVHLALPDAGSRLARRMGARWWAVLPTHVQYFTRTSLFTLLERHAYAPLWAGTAPKTFSVDYYLWRIGGYSRPVSGALRRAARAAGVSGRLWGPDFRDRMAVVARRPVERSR